MTYIFKCNNFDKRTLGVLKFGLVQLEYLPGDNSLILFLSPKKIQI